jgi:hypothetical protein
MYRWAAIGSFSAQPLGPSGGGWSCAPAGEASVSARVTASHHARRHGSGRRADVA